MRKLLFLLSLAFFVKGGCDDEVEDDDGLCERNFVYF